MASADSKVKPSSSAVEFTVDVPKMSDTKTYSVMKFNQSLSVDVMSWESVHLVRENNQKVFEHTDDQPEFGAGSEYGRAERMEQRRKKLGLQASKYNLDAQPWILTTDNETKNARQFKGIREGGAGEHADYWIFKKTKDNHFDALPIEAWYNFLPIARYKTLDIDEAEEQFQKRNKVMNQFALKTQLGFDDEAVKEKDSNLKRMKISDRDEYDSDIDQDSDHEEKDADVDAPGKAAKGKKTPNKKSQKNAPKQRKAKKEREEGDDEYEAEPSDGELEGMELDYSSDSGSEPEETLDEEEKRDEKGVGDETGLRKLLSDDEDEGEEENEGEDAEDGNSKDSIPETKTIKKEKRDSDSDDSGEESDDPDKEHVKSAVFLQDKGIKTEELSEEKSDSKKEEQPGPSAKKIKLETHPSGISVEDVRRYLLRKPMTTKDLLAKLKPKAKDMNKDQLINHLADIMKQINPKKNETKRNGKKVSLFSLS